MTLRNACRRTSVLATIAVATTSLLVASGGGLSTAASGAAAPTTVTGTGRTLYSGTVPITVTKGTLRYELRDPTRGNTEVYDQGNKATSTMLCIWFRICAGDGNLITSTSTTFGNFAMSSRATVGADAMWAAQQSWDFLARRGVSGGWYGDGQGVRILVHHDVGGATAWVPTGQRKVMVPDGNGNEYGPTVDQVSSELFGQYVNRTQSKFGYASGSIRTAWTNVLATEMEWQLNRPEDVPDYIVFERSWRSLPGKIGFDNPERYGATSCAPANYDAPVSSGGYPGVAMKQYYLLAEGSGAKTINGVSYNATTCDGSSHVGIGRDKAFSIWWDTLSANKPEKWADFRDQMIATVTAKYGAGSPEATAVAATWRAVGIV